MRLINVNTKLFETFNDESKLPPYAILSHRWVENQEIVYKDFLKGRNLHLSGWEKIDRCCLQALEDGLTYIWVDTCCIDKKSSAELSEAINSMYRWYGTSTVCYAYLNDVDQKGDWVTEFIKSMWFTRSWTLQEMLAPECLKFFDVDWHYLGEKSSLSEELAEASGIALSVFTSERLCLTDWSVAQRMSWASKREATRVEDVAYSLLGIFDVNMPLLYGEGSKAFSRLQEEIIRGSHDHTIFAWSSAPSTSWGLLAPSPKSFERDGNMTIHQFQSPKAYTLTNLGLSIELPLQLWLPKVYWAGLNVTSNGIDQIGIWVLANDTQRGLYHKATISSTFSADESEVNGSAYVASRYPARIKALKTQLVLPLHETQPPLIPRLGAHQGDAYGSTWTTFASFDFQAVRVIKSESEYDDLLPVNFTGSPGEPLYPHPPTEVNLYARYPYDSTGSIWTFGVYHWQTTTLVARTLGIRFADRRWPCTGFICDMAFPSGVSIGVLSAGFDKEMCPIFLLAEPFHIHASDIPTSASEAAARRAEAPGNMHLARKNIWQCHGLETDGWQEPSSKPLSSKSSMSKGLWAFRATEEPSSSFLIRPYSFPKRCVNIVVTRQKKERFEYSISISESYH